MVMLVQRSGAAIGLWRIILYPGPSPASQVRQYCSLPNTILYEDDQHSIRDKSIPKPVWECLHQLRVAGHEVFLVGGAVRDLLLQQQDPKDFDLLTSAQLHKVKDMFPHHKPCIIGKNFPICQLEVKGHKVEVSSMHTRSAVKPWSSAAAPVSIPADVAEHLLGTCSAPGRSRRHSVVPHTLHQQKQPLSWAAARRVNAAARDFTANALLYDPFQRIVYDYVGGVADIRAGQLRCVGDAMARFQADPACLLRAVRCAARAGLKLESSTLSGLQAQSHLVLHLNSQRITAELMAMLAYGAAAPSLQLLQQTQLMRHVLPAHSRQQQQRKQGKAWKNNSRSCSSRISLQDSSSTEAIYSTVRISEQQQATAAPAGAVQPSADSALGQMLHNLAVQNQHHQLHSVCKQQTQSPKAPAPVDAEQQQDNPMQEMLDQHQSLLMQVAAALDQHVSVKQPATAEVVLACLTAPLVIGVLQQAVQQVQLYQQQQQLVQQAEQVETAAVQDDVNHGQQQEQQAMAGLFGSPDNNVMQPYHTPSSLHGSEIWTVQVTDSGVSASMQQRAAAARAYSTSSCHGDPTVATGDSGIAGLSPVAQQLLCGVSFEDVVHQQAVHLANQICTLSPAEGADSSYSSSGQQLFGVHTAQSAADLLSMHVRVCKASRELAQASNHTAAALGRKASKHQPCLAHQRQQHLPMSTQRQINSVEASNNGCNSSSKGVRTISSSAAANQRRDYDYIDYGHAYPRTNKQYMRLMEQQRQAAVQQQHTGTLEPIPSTRAILMAAAEAVSQGEWGDEEFYDKQQQDTTQQTHDVRFVAGLWLTEQEHLIHKVLLSARAGFDTLEAAATCVRHGG